MRRTPQYQARRGSSYSGPTQRYRRQQQSRSPAQRRRFNPSMRRSFGGSNRRSSFTRRGGPTRANQNMRQSNIFRGASRRSSRFNQLSSRSGQGRLRLQMHNARGRQRYSGQAGLNPSRTSSARNPGFGNPRYAGAGRTRFRNGRQSVQPYRNSGRQGPRFPQRGVVSMRRDHQQRRFNNPGNQRVSDSDYSRSDRMVPVDRSTLSNTGRQQGAGASDYTGPRGRNSFGGTTSSNIYESSRGQHDQQMAPLNRRSESVRGQSETRYEVTPEHRPRDGVARVETPTANIHIYDTADDPPAVNVYITNAGGSRGEPLAAYTTVAGSRRVDPSPQPTIDSSAVIDGGSQDGHGPATGPVFRVLPGALPLDTSETQPADLYQPGSAIPNYSYAQNLNAAMYYASAGQNAQSPGK